MSRPSSPRIAVLLLVATLASGSALCAAPQAANPHSGQLAAARPLSLAMAGSWLWAALSGAWGMPGFFPFNIKPAHPSGHAVGAADSGCIIDPGGCRPVANSGCGIDPGGCLPRAGAPAGGRALVPPPEGDSGCIIDPYGQCRP